MKQGGNQTMSKRDRMLDLADGHEEPGYVPAAFFLHFDQAFHRGQAAVDRHMEYFRATGMDFVKIQYEHPFPVLPQIARPDDWKTAPRLDARYFSEPLDVVQGIVEAVNGEALVVVTLYSAIMHAAHATTREMLTEHLDQDPEAVARGLRLINQGILVFIRECLKRGVDGFYASSQGGEAGRFKDPSVFTRVIKPLDLEVMNEIDQRARFNILHVCDYQGPLEDLTPYVDYPGHIVNSPTRLKSRALTPRQVSEMFKRPFMGGMDRLGVIATGNPVQIGQEVTQILRDAPPAFVLGADCTVPSSVPVQNLKAAIDTAHGGGRD